MSTRLVGTAIEALVMSAPFVRPPSPETGTTRTLEHGHLLTVDFLAFSGDARLATGTVT
jgi:hypothetical protein